MRVMGWCTECLRFRQVSVKPYGAFIGGVERGICGECEDATSKPPPPAEEQRSAERG